MAPRRRRVLPPRPFGAPLGMRKKKNRRRDKYRTNTTFPRAIPPQSALRSRHGPNPHQGRHAAQRAHPDRRRQERRAAADDGGALDRRAAQLCGTCRASPTSPPWRIFWFSTAFPSPCAAPSARTSRGHVLELDARRIVSTTAPYDLVRKMRASVLVLGPLLARCGEARVSLPGGCAIGTRPVDLHLKGLQRLGARSSCNRAISRRARRRGSIGAEIVFPIVSVGATENLMMAATLGRGRNRAGQRRARARDRRSRALPQRDGRADRRRRHATASRISGVERLHGAEHSVIPDRIETGTYMMAAAITGGAVELVGARLEHRRRGGAHPRRRRRRDRRDRRAALRCAARNGRIERRRCDDRAVSRLPDRSPGADDGADERPPTARR